MGRQMRLLRHDRIKDQLARVSRCQVSNRAEEGFKDIYRVGIIRSEENLRRYSIEINIKPANDFCDHLLRGRCCNRYFGATGVTSAAAGAITANLAYYSAVLAAGFQRKLREELEVVKYDARDLRTIINPLSLRILPSSTPHT